MEYEDFSSTHILAMTSLTPSCRFDDASVHPTSLQSALHTSAYVIFYEMTRPSRDAMLAPRALQEAKTPDQKRASSGPAPSLPSPKLIGPALPPQLKIRPTLISEPPAKPKPKPAPAPLVRPKATAELVAAKTVLPALPKGGLVPYGSDSDSDERPPTPAKTAPQLLKTPARAAPELLKTPSTVAPELLKSPEASGQKATVVAGPFLPRSVAVNFKKLQESPADKRLQEAVAKKPEAAKAEPKPEPPNRDPSSEALYSPAKPVLAARASESRNEFSISDLDAHNPSVHSDNSAGSTASFTVSDISSTTRPSSSAACSEASVTSRQKWTVTPSPKTVPDRLAVTKTVSAKRERSVPPSSLAVKQQEEEEQSVSDTELMASPKKRKKTAGIFDGSHLLEKVAEVGKDVWSLGSKIGANLFKPKAKLDDTTSTACEATTSHHDVKASSSTKTGVRTEIDQEADDEGEVERRKEKKHKKKKKKHKKRAEDEEEWEEKREKKERREEVEERAGREKKSSYNPEIPTKRFILN